MILSDYTFYVAMIHSTNTNRKRTRGMYWSPWHGDLSAIMGGDLVMQTALHDETLTHDVDYDLFYQLLELTTFGHLAKYLVYIRQQSGRTTIQQLELAKVPRRQSGQVRYSPEYAYHRARRHPEWLPAKEEGLALGEHLREQRARNKQPTL